MTTTQCTCFNPFCQDICPEHTSSDQVARAGDWAMIRPISEIKQEVFPQRVQVHHATTSYGGSIDKDDRDY